MRNLNCLTLLFAFTVWVNDGRIHRCWVVFIFWHFVRFIDKIVCIFTKWFRRLVSRECCRNCRFGIRAVWRNYFWRRSSRRFDTWGWVVVYFFADVNIVWVTVAIKVKLIVLSFDKASFYQWNDYIISYQTWFWQACICIDNALIKI